jgi:hypothetical protein
MNLLIVLAALVFLMFIAYRGYSVILFAPVAAMGAVLLTDPSLVPPLFSSVFMEKMVGFVKSYFPVFMLGAVFGKVIELSGFSKSIVSAVIGVLGRERAVLSIVVVCAILTYGGVSLFVVVFAVYPFAAEMFRQGDIPKRPHPRHRRARRVQLHDGRLAGDAADPEHHPNHLLQHDHVGGPGPWPDRQRFRVRRGHCLYRESPPRRAKERRGLWHRASKRAGAVRGEGIAEPLDRAFAAGGGRRCKLRIDENGAPGLRRHA